MTVYFSNKGALELDLVRIMGAHVKTNENPIGHFGTGLKYAIATLLRTGHKVTMMIAGEQYRFHTKPKEIRGKSFDMIYMNDEQLPFTLDLGKNWKVWQAYRELHSNTLDEMGEITDTMVVNDTVIIVQGSEIQSCFYDRGTIFLDTRNPDVMTENNQFWRRRSNHLYYRGVRVHDTPKPTRLTYNRLRAGELTEDRTFKSVYDYSFYVCWDLIYNISDPNVIESAVCAGDQFWESGLDFSNHSGQPSDTFMSVMGSLKLSKIMNESAWRLFVKFAGFEEKSIRECELHDSEEEVLEASLKLLKNMEVYLSRSDFSVVDNLGPNVLGRVSENRIYISRQAIQLGDGAVAGTLLEEYCHKYHGYEDESRAFQNHLIDRVVGLARKL